MSFTGRFDYQLDEKNRFRMPSKLKDSLKGSSLRLFQLPGKKHFTIVTAEKFDELLTNKFGEFSPFGNDSKIQAALRIIAANTVSIEEDNQGRYTLPKKAREQCGFNKNIVFIAVQNVIEVWPLEVYEEQLTQWQEEAMELFN